MKEKTPHQEIVKEKERHARKMKSIYEKYGIKEVIELMDEIESKMEKTVEMNKEFRENLFPLLCEMTEGKRTTISKKFTLRNDSLYKYSSSDVVKPSKFIRDSNKGRWFRSKRGEFGERDPVPYYYVSENISKYGIANGTGKKLEEFVKMIKEYRKELVCAKNEFKTLGSNKHGYKFKETIKFENKTVYDNYSAVVNQTDSLDMLYIFKRSYKDRNGEIIFFEEVSIDDGEIVIDEEDFLFSVDENNLMNHKKFLENEERIERTLKLLEKADAYVEHVMKIHEKLLDAMENKFTVERVSREI